MDGSEAFESNAQTPEVMQPGVGSFDDPAGFAKTAAMRHAASRDLGGDTGGVQGLTVLVMVVATIGLDQARLGERPAALAADRRNSLDERQELGDVVTVGAGQDHRERDALRFGDEMVLGAGASAIGGIRSCF